MPIVNGLQIDIQLYDEDTALDERFAENARENKTRRQRCISADPEYPILIRVRFMDRFRWFGTDALLVAIASGPANSAKEKQWDTSSIICDAIEHNHEKDNGQHEDGYYFGSLYMPETDASFRGRITHDRSKIVRDNTFDRFDFERVKAKDNCITVWIQRGFLSEDSVADATDQHERMNRVPVSGSKWFTPLGDARADVAHVEYRNIPRHHIYSSEPGVSIRRSTRIRDMPDYTDPEIESPQFRRRRARLPSGDTEDSNNGLAQSGGCDNICDDDEDDDEPMKDEPAEEQPEAEHSMKEELAGEPQEAEQAVQDVAMEEQVMEKIPFANGNGVEADVHKGASPAHTQESAIVESNAEQRTKARKAAQLELSQRRLDLERRKIELQEQQLNLDQQRMEMEYDD